MKFTNASVRALKAQDKPYITVETGTERGVGRLAVKVYPNKRKAFLYIWFEDGKRKVKTLGSFPDLGIADARLQVATLSARYQKTGTAHDGGKHDRRKTGTFGDLLDAYIADMKSSGKRSWMETDRQLTSYLRNRHPEMLNTPARDITTGDLVAVLRAIHDRGAQNAYIKVRAYLRKAWQVGLHHDNDPTTEHRAVRFGLTTNVVDAIPAKREFKRVGTRWLPVSEARSVWGELDKVMRSADDAVAGVGVQSAALLMLSLVTGQRAGEWRRMRWADVDLEHADGARALIPASTFKTGIDHLVPLGELAVSVLERLGAWQDKHGGRSELVFPARFRSKLIGGAMAHRTYGEAAKLVATEVGIPDWTPRDLRRTWKTLAGEAGLSKEERDWVQGHKASDVSAVHYDFYSYYREKQQAMLKWERWFSARVLGDGQGAVVNGPWR